MAPSRQLVVRRGGRTVLTYTVKRGTCTIGRSPENDLVLPDAAVSPRHAEVRTEAGATVLTDLDSEQGTLLDDVRLLPRQPRALDPGQSITIGPFELLFRAAAESKQTASHEPPRSVEGQSAEDTAAIADTPPAAAAAPPALPPPSDPAVAPDPPAPQRPPAEPEVRGPRASSRYMRYLPVIFHDDDFLTRFLQLFEEVWEPLEQRQDHVDIYFSPMTCPVEWLPWMASWFGITLEDHWPEARKRALLHGVIDIYRWRGTAYGLERVIEACIGVRPEISVAPENPFVFHVTVRPADAPDEHLEEDLNELINAHKPAHTGYTLEILR